MKFRILALGALGLALVGCQQATTTTASSAFGDTKALTVSSTSTKVYYSLKTGTQVTDPAAIASKDWDVAFNSSTQGIWTNSGETATGASSGGVGGVYYSGSTVFTGVTSYDASKVKVDTVYWVKTASGFNNNQYTYGDPVQSVLNAITYLVYDSGTGTSDAPLVNNGADANYAGTAYYVAHSVTNGPPTYTMGNEVYIIKSGDGTKYFKFQVTSLSGSSSSRDRTIKYAVSN